MGQQRSVQTVAEQRRVCDPDSSVSKKHPEEEAKPKRRVSVTALIAWPRFSFLRMEQKVDKQVAAPTETRTPNLHQRKSLIEECGWQGGDSGDSAEGKTLSNGKQRTHLTPNGPLMEGDYTD